VTTKRVRAPTHDAAFEVVAGPAEEHLLLLDGFLGRHLFRFCVSADCGQDKGDARSGRKPRAGGGRKFESSTCCWSRKGGYHRREGKGKVPGGARGDGGVAERCLAGSLCSACGWAARTQAGKRKTGKQIRLVGKCKLFFRRSSHPSDIPRRLDGVALRVSGANLGTGGPVLSIASTMSRLHIPLTAARSSNLPLL